MQYPNRGPCLITRNQRVCEPAAKEATDAGITNIMRQMMRSREVNNNDGASHAMQLAQDMSASGSIMYCMVRMPIAKE